MEDYFALLSINREFDIDPAQLKSAYKKGIARHHPDRAKSQQESAGLTAKSSLINKAYEILRDPARRALHLLELQGIDIDSPKYGGKITPSELAGFLEEFELIDNAKTKDELLGILSSKLALREEILQDISKAFANSAFDLAAICLLRLRYSLRLIENIERK